MSESIYKEHGFSNRQEYLNSLAEEYGCSLYLVTSLSDMFGEAEDFDGLVSALNDFEMGVY